MFNQDKQAQLALNKFYGSKFSESTKHLSSLSNDRRMTKLSDSPRPLQKCNPIVLNELMEENKKGNIYSNLKKGQHLI